MEIFRQCRDPSDICTPDPRDQAVLIWLWKTQQDLTKVPVWIFA